MPFYERQPYITPLYQVLLEILRGEIRVPRFQRPGSDLVWRSEQRGDLLDSLYRGFPIGTILLWSTTKPIRCMERVAGFTIPPIKDIGRPTRLLLDGHQRLSTLLAVLGPGLENEVREAFQGRHNILDESWVFETRSDDAPTTNVDSTRSRDRFVPLRVSDEKPSKTQLPLDIVLDRVKMNRWTRENCLGSDDQVRAAESVRDKLREYSIPVAVLVADSLDEATESFKRVNSSGTPMSTFHMVKALAYADTFDLEELFAKLREEYLQPGNWNELEDADLLRICAGLVEGGDALKFGVEDLAEKLRQKPGALTTAFKACAAAALALEELGILSPKALPYTWQLIILAVVLGERSDPKLAPSEKAGFNEWFWVTTYGEVFAGVTARYARARDALKQMLASEAWEKTDMGIRDVGRTVPVEWRFDYRTVRSKAFALLLARLHDGENLRGEAHRALAEKGRDALCPIRGSRSKPFELILITRQQELQDMKTAFNALSSSQLEIQPQNNCLLPHGFLVQGQSPCDPDAVIEARNRNLRNKEKDFVESFRLNWGSPARQGAELTAEPAESTR